MSAALRQRLTPIDPWPVAGTVDAHVRAEQVRVLFQQAPPAQLLALVAVAVITWALWPVADHARLTLWVALVTAMTLGRIALSLAFRRADPPPDRMATWERAFMATLAGICLAWGVGGWWIMPAQSVVHQAIVYFFLMGMAGGAAATYAAHTAASSVAVCVLMLPATIAFALEPVPELRAMAVGGVLYLGAALRSTRTFGFFLRRTFQLSYDLHKAYGRAQELARTDELTGLANRRAFLEHGRAALDQARRYGRALAVVMVDIDHFKRVNDTHGHAAGDAVLREVAAALQRAARAADVPGRLGGEEFALLLPETGGSAATAVAERLRSDVAALRVAGSDGDIRLTCSFGVSEASRETPHLDTLLDAADRALYRAKANGRDRVERER